MDFATAGVPEFAAHVEERLKQRAARLRAEAHDLLLKAEALEAEARDVWHDGYTWEKAHYDGTDLQARKESK